MPFGGPQSHRTVFGKSWQDFFAVNQLNTVIMVYMYVYEIVKLVMTLVKSTPAQ